MYFFVVINHQFKEKKETKQRKKVLIYIIKISILFNKIYKAWFVSGLFIVLYIVKDLNGKKPLHLGIKSRPLLHKFMDTIVKGNQKQKYYLNIQIWNCIVDSFCIHIAVNKILHTSHLDNFPYNFHQMYQLDILQIKKFQMNVLYHIRNISFIDMGIWF